MQAPPRLNSSPDLSLVMPCYNEAAIVGYTIGRLLTAFAKAGYHLELIAVDNGSHDSTGTILRQLAGTHGAVRYHRVEENQGYGHGILQGLPFCSAPWIGIIPADGQVDAEDVVRLFEAARAAGRDVLAKVYRRFRMEGLHRKLASWVYNSLLRLLWPSFQAADANGNPKLLPAAVLRDLQLKSRNWLLDPEILIKVHYLGLPVLELNVFDRMRSTGRSHVRLGTCWEFLCGLLAYRFSGELARWRQGLSILDLPAATSRNRELEETPCRR